MNRSMKKKKKNRQRTVNKLSLQARAISLCKSDVVEGKLQEIFFVDYGQTKERADKPAEEFCSFRVVFHEKKRWIL